MRQETGKAASAMIVALLDEVVWGGGPELVGHWRWVHVIMPPMSCPQHLRIPPQPSLPTHQLACTLSHKHTRT